MEGGIGVWQRDNRFDGLIRYDARDGAYAALGKKTVYVRCVLAPCRY